MAQIHNSKQRMPVIVPEGIERYWLDPLLSHEEVLALCAPAPDDLLEDWPVSTLITTRGVDTNVPEVWAPQQYPELDRNSDQAASLFSS